MWILSHFKLCYIAFVHNHVIPFVLCHTHVGSRRGARVDAVLRRGRNATVVSFDGQVLQQESALSVERTTSQEMLRKRSVEQIARWQRKRDALLMRQAEEDVSSALVEHNITTRDAIFDASAAVDCTSLGQSSTENGSAGVESKYLWPEKATKPAWNATDATKFDDVLDTLAKSGVWHPTLGGGTLLGAYRNRGTIPFDLDMDMGLNVCELETASDEAKRTVGKSIGDSDSTIFDDAASAFSTNTITPAAPQVNNLSMSQSKTADSGRTSNATTASKSKSICDYLSNALVEKFNNDSVAYNTWLFEKVVAPLLPQTR